MHNGQCIEINDEDYKCVCPTGYMGKNCNGRWFKTQITKCKTLGAEPSLLSAPHFETLFLQPAIRGTRISQGFKQALKTSLLSYGISSMNHFVHSIYFSVDFLVIISFSLGVLCVTCWYFFAFFAAPENMYIKVGWVSVVLSRTVVVDNDCQQQQQSYSGLRSPGRSNSTYFWNDSWVQTFHNMYIVLAQY